MAIRIGAKADASEGAGRQGGLRWIPIRRCHPMPITRLNHAVLYVADLDRSVRFYTDVMGFRAIPMTPEGFRAAFLQAPGSINDHDLGLFEIGSQAAPSAAGRSTVGLYLVMEKGRYGAETQGGIRPDAVR